MPLELAFNYLFCLIFSFKLVTFSKSCARKQKWVFFSEHSVVRQYNDLAQLYRSGFCLDVFTVIFTLRSQLRRARVKLTVSRMNRTQKNVNIKISGRLLTRIIVNQLRYINYVIIMLKQAYQDLHQSMMYWWSEQLVSWWKHNIPIFAIFLNLKNP